jgi:hypothetical protein
MIFGRDLVFCADFGDFNDDVVIVGVNFIGRRLICGHYRKGEECLWTLPTRIVILRPILRPTMQLPIFFHQLRCVLDWFMNVGSCELSNFGLMLYRLHSGFGIRLHRKKTMEEFG